MVGIVSIAEHILIIDHAQRIISLSTLNIDKYYNKSYQSHKLITTLFHNIITKIYKIIIKITIEILIPIHHAPTPSSTPSSPLIIRSPYS